MNIHFDIPTIHIDKLSNFEQFQVHKKSEIIDHPDGSITKEKLNEELITTVNSAEAHIASIENPHKVTKEQIGLSNADNTADIDKPISTATQAVLDSCIKKNDFPTNPTEDTQIGNPGALELRYQGGLININDTIVIDPATANIIDTKSSERMPIVPSSMAYAMAKSTHQSMDENIVSNMITTKKTEKYNVSAEELPVSVKAIKEYMPMRILSGTELPQVDYYQNIGSKYYGTVFLLHEYGSATASLYYCGFVNTEYGWIKIG
ncbi:MAG: hypothetical protein IJ460_04545 [Clostridia bacterium]|nr:hypothetical protein [Clostridia bacterium]